MPTLMAMWKKSWQQSLLQVVILYTLQGLFIGIPLLVLAPFLAAAATSAPSPSRPAGILAKSAAFCVSFSTSVMGEAMKPGAMQLAVTLRLATSAANALVKPIMPALEAA